MGKKVVRPFSLGIVGPAQEKFTPLTESLARESAYNALISFKATTLVSGRSPMGGVDLFAEEAAEDLGIETLIFPPTRNTWLGVGGFRDRNLKIASYSNLVLVIVIERLPTDFDGMRFGYCYHCEGRNPPHVKSGGCWTAWKARDRRWLILDDDE